MRDVRGAFLGVALSCAWLLACSRGGAPSDVPPPETEAEAARPELPSLTTPAADASADTSANLASVITTVLDSRPMVMYLHPEIEGRVPVAIGGPALAGATLEVIAQGVPVKMCTDTEIAKPGTACVIFERIELAEPTAEVELRYPIEGVVGTFRLAREGEGWRILKAELAER